MTIRRILWQSRDDPGHEWCELRTGPGASRVAGTVVLAADGVPWRIAYEIDLDAKGLTRRVRVTADGRRVAPIVIDLSADGRGRWTHTASAEVVVDRPDALDVDLGFSPSTNSLPVRRLGLAIGESREIEVCWVLFPSFEVKVGRQRYARLGERTWRYRSGDFEAELAVDADGLVEAYADWRMVRNITVDGDP
jgi:hypothetical protein